MRNTIILSVLLFLVAIAVAVFYFNNINPNEKQQSNSLTQIPDDAALLISFTNDSISYAELHENPGFEKVLGKSFIRGLYSWYQRYLNQASLDNLIGGQTVYMSFHPGSKQLDFLINLPLKEKIETKELLDYLKSGPDSLEIEAQGKDADSYWVLTAPDIQNQVFMHVGDQHLILSFSEALLQHALADETHMLSNDIVQRINAHKGQALKLFVDHHQLDAFFKILSKSGSDNMHLFSDIPAFSALNYNPKSGTLMFSGRTFPESRDSTYLELFAYQEPIPQLIYTQLSNQVAFVSDFGVSDYPSFHEGLRRLIDQRGELNQINAQLRLIENKKDMVLGDQLLRSIGPEFAKVTLNTGEKVGIFQVPDSLNFQLAIDTLSTLERDSSMRRFDHSNLVYYCYGDPFEEFRRPYFLYHAGFAFISNHKSTLNTYIKYLKAGELLMEEPAFQAYDQLQSNQSNISLFVHRANAENLIRLKLRDSYAFNFMDGQRFGYKDFYAFSLQLHGNKGEFISNLYGKFAQADP